ncbi:MAG TPA: Maf family nucleotide pyrophosphatase [Cellvibrio sp.]
MPPLQILLASSSIYRRQLLQKLGVSFESASPDIDESALPGETARQLVLRLAQAKANKLAQIHKRHLIIGSDQVATYENNILGKPQNHDAAIGQLEQFSGRHITFLTSLCLLNSQSTQRQLSVESCTVKFRPLSKSQIESYLAKEQPYDCAGSFKSEGLGIALFESIHTDDPNILIGLPLIRLTDMLIKEGVDPLTYAPNRSHNNN